MYEASFGLKRRPFAATPDATCFLSAGPIQAALDEILVCVEQGQGIAVLTAPAGIGKTLLCEKLVSELGTRFQTVFLRHSSFLTRRALLQTLLCELKRAYHHPSEQELRLELSPAIREVRPEREALVVICDEAHHLTESLLEELRVLSDFAESGRPLVRLVLVGQLSLEEKLTQPSLEAINQRIRAHVYLPTFDRAGSLDYIDYRLTWGGGRTDEIFTPAALDVIARASDGIPRCINQLADHSLLLAFVAEQKPVGEAIVLEALNDLRQLPLHWNESSLSKSFVATPDHLNNDAENAIEPSTPRRDVADGIVEATSNGHGSNGHTYSFEPMQSDNGSYESQLEAASFEVGAELGADLVPDAVAIVPSAKIDDVTFEDSDPVNEIKIDAGSEDWRQTLNLFKPSQNEVKIAKVDGRPSTTTLGTTRIPTLAPTLPISGFHEEVVVDRYVSIDAGLPPAELPSSELPSSELPSSAMMSADTTDTEMVRTVPLAVARSVESVSADPSHFDHDDEMEFDVEIRHTPRQVTTDVASELETETLRLEHMLGVVRELINVVSEQVGESQPEPETDFTQFENLAARIDSSHETSGPAGLTVIDHNSVLNTLRTKVEIDSGPDEVSFGGWSQATTEPAWESVETTPVESTEKPRPFRYLFSMLRRKQQQQAE